MSSFVLICALLIQIAGKPVASGSVSGQLLSKEGQPAVGIRVSAMAAPDAGASIGTASTLVSFVLTDSAGRYRLENVPAGRYYIIAGLVEQPAYYPGVASASGATVVNVAAGSEVRNINFVMAAGAGVTVSGRVIRPPNTSMPVSRVALIGTNPMQDIVLNADGSFAFTRVRPGNYTLLVSSNPTHSTSLVVADRDITGIEVVIPVTAEVTGNMVVENDGVRPRVSLTFLSFKGGVNNPIATLLPTGFRMQLPEGDYRVAWSALPAGYTLRSITAGPQDLLAETFKVRSSSPPPPIVVTLGVSSPAPWVKLSGKVSGLSATSQAYRLVLTGPTVDPLDVPIGPDGSYEFARVLPGSYAMRLSPAVPLPSTPVVVGSRDTAFDISLPPMKEVVGRVVVEGLASVVPRLNFQMTDGTSPLNSPATARPDGTFVVTLPEGDRRVTLNVPGYSVKSLSYGAANLLQETLRLTAASSAEFRVTLIPMAGVGGPPAGVGTGVVGGVFGGIIATPNAPPTPLPAGVQRIAPAVAQANLVSQVQPAYPPDARAARVAGAVTLNVIISAEGAVQNVTVASGHPMLTGAAIDAVRQWRFRPQLLDGKPVPVSTVITVNFALQ